MEETSDDLIQKREDSREPYEKPSLEVIQLTAGEVLGIGCKTWYTTCAGGSAQNGS